MKSQIIMNGIFSFPVKVDETYSVKPTIPYNIEASFDIHFSKDMDVHIFSALNSDGDYRDPFENMFFSFEEYPIISGILKNIAAAIEQDNQLEMQNPEIVTDATVLMDQIIEQYAFYDTVGTFSIVHDDNGGNFDETLEISIVNQGVYVRVNSMNGLRFRTHFGGGKKHRVRNMLAFLAYAISKGYE